MTRRISRREFLVVSGATVATGLAAACGPSEPDVPADAAPADAPAADEPAMPMGKYREAPELSEMVQAGLLPEALADVADRSRFARVDGSPLNPLRLALHVLEWFDRNNTMDEAPGRSTVNLALRASKPL